ncbi:3827_t:CDS:2, partial [Ambispora leptoticha]
MVSDFLRTRNGAAFLPVVLFYMHFCKKSVYLVQLAMAQGPASFKHDQQISPSDCPMLPCHELIFIKEAKLLEYSNSHRAEEWSLSQFLVLYREKILTAPPFHDDWHALDGTWSRRFTWAGQELNNNIDLKKKIETKLIIDKEGLQTLHTSVKSHGERVRTNYDNREANERDYGHQHVSGENNSATSEQDKEPFKDCNDEINDFFDNSSGTEKQLTNSFNKRLKSDPNSEGDDSAESEDEESESESSGSEYMPSDTDGPKPAPLLLPSKLKYFTEFYTGMISPRNGYCLQEHVSKMFSFMREK